MTANASSKASALLTRCLATAALVGVYCLATGGVSTLMMTATDSSAQAARGGGGHAGGRGGGGHMGGHMGGRGGVHVGIHVGGTRVVRVGHVGRVGVRVGRVGVRGVRVGRVGWVGRGHFWRGRWWAYGVGPCWRLIRPGRWIWICG